MHCHTVPENFDLLGAGINVLILLGVMFLHMGSKVKVE